MQCLFGFIATVPECVIVLKESGKCCLFCVLSLNNLKCVQGAECSFETTSCVKLLRLSISFDLSGLLASELWDCILLIDQCPRLVLQSIGYDI